MVFHSDLTGSILDRRYRITGLLGKGGMGYVYEAMHMALDQPVAVKVLHPRYANEGRFRERFLQEARAASRIHHPNVVDIKDFGDAPDGSAYFVMEYLRGHDVGDELRRHGSLPWARTRRILLQAASALHAAHQSRIVHRDIKPGNCFLVEDAAAGLVDVVKLLDFGIAKVGSDSHATAQSKGLTGTGEVFGTASYMSPEQARGEVLDARSDMYSLGIMAYEMLVGAVPFTGPNPIVVIGRHLKDEPEPLRSHVPELPAVVEELVLKMIAKKARDRYPSMEALERALREIPENAGVRRTRLWSSPGDLRALVQEKKAGAGGGEVLPPGGVGADDERTTVVPGKVRASIGAAVAKRVVGKEASEAAAPMESRMAMPGRGAVATPVESRMATPGRAGVATPGGSRMATPERALATPERAAAAAQVRTPGAGTPGAFARPGTVERASAAPGISAAAGPVGPTGWATPGGAAVDRAFAMPPVRAPELAMPVGAVPSACATPSERVHPSVEAGVPTPRVAPSTAPALAPAAFVAPAPVAAAPPQGPVAPVPSFVAQPFGPQGASPSPLAATLAAEPVAALAGGRNEGLAPASASGDRVAASWSPSTSSTGPHHRVGDTGTETKPDVFELPPAGGISGRLVAVVLLLVVLVGGASAMITMLMLGGPGATQEGESPKDLTRVTPEVDASAAASEDRSIEGRGGPIAGSGAIEPLDTPESAVSADEDAEAPGAAADASPNADVDAGRPKEDDVAAPDGGVGSTKVGTSDQPKVPEHETPKCVEGRDRARVALAQRSWSEMVKQVQRKGCWSQGEQTARRRLYVRALLELESFADCIKVGGKSKDPEIVKMVAICHKQVG